MVSISKRGLLVFAMSVCCVTGCTSASQALSGSHSPETEPATAEEYIAAACQQVFRGDQENRHGDALPYFKEAARLAADGPDLPDDDRRIPDLNQIWWDTQALADGEGWGDIVAGLEPPCAAFGVYP